MDEEYEYQDTREFKPEPIRGKDEMQTAKEASYPYILIESTDESPIPLYKMKALKSMLTAAEKLISTSDKHKKLAVNIYYKAGDKTVELGRLPKPQIAPFLQLFTGNTLTGMYDKDRKLEGDMLYVLI